jgi:hypothetical protein
MSLPLFPTIFVHFLFVIVLLSEADEILKNCKVIGSPTSKLGPKD